MLRQFIEEFKGGFAKAMMSGMFQVPREDSSRDIDKVFIPGKKKKKKMPYEVLTSKNIGTEFQYRKGTWQSQGTPYSS
ncbi:MAG: hypothetical protein HQK96_18535 [Nitrospirae bacterium]|nr:hypothetical protein [Nitrospirota bacterium]